MSQGVQTEAVAAAAERILAAYGRPETSDSARVIYTAGDLNVAREAGVLEVVFRGTLVFRRAPAGQAGEQVFEEHGIWRAELERIAQSLP